MKTGLLDAPRWLLLAILVFAPWAGGCTAAWSVAWLNGLVAAVLALWGVRCWKRRSWPRIHPVLLASAAWLALQGWTMAMNAHALSAPLFASAEWPPSSVNPAASLALALRITLLLGLACFVSDLARHSIWRKRVWGAVSFAGVSIVLLGLAQRLANAPGIFWDPANTSDTFFATFDYHANAGAFINLAWPLVAGGLVAALLKPARGPRVRWALALMLCLVGMFVNTSRGSSFVAVVLMLVLIGWFVGMVCRHEIPGLQPLVVITTLVLLLLITAGAAVLVGTERSWQHWSVFARNELSAQNPRLVTARVCLEIVPQAGWWGYGPGTFTNVFPSYTNRVAMPVPPGIVFAHEDYLQTIIEWGCAGGAFWGLALVGGAVFSIWKKIRRGRRWSSRDRVLHFATLTALFGVALHALVDYPLQVASIQAYVAVFTGLLWSAGAWNGGKEKSGGRESQTADTERLESEAG